MRLPAPIHAHTIYRAAVAVRGEHSVYHHLSEVRDMQRWSTDQLERYQREHIARILTFAALQVPFWKQRGLRKLVMDSDAIQRLRELPFTTKNHLQTARASMRPLDPTRSARKSTGGSTAEPVVLEKSPDAIAREMAASWMAQEWFGIRMGDPAARFWGNPLTAQRRFRRRLADLAMNRVWINAFSLTDESLHDYWRTLKRFRPRWLYGYASLVDLFAQFIEREGLDVRSLGIQLVVPTSEPTTPDMRERIARVFGAPIQNEYGCGEFGPIAYECERGLMHLMSPNLYVEILTEDDREAQPGETGEIVVTDLFNFAQPLIRYRMGDRAVKGGPCPCGRAFPTLERVWGRIWDVVYTPAGERIHGEKIDYLFAQVYREQPTAFRQYQVVQSGPDRVTVNLVADAEIPEAIERRIRAYFVESCDGMDATIQRVDTIERARSGKLRTVRNDWLQTAETASQN